MVARAFLFAVSLLPALALGQTAPAPPPPASAEGAAASRPLPVRRVVLYKTGIGYFEHLGRVRDRQDVTIRFTSAQLNDVLKSLTTIDLGQGQVTGISYNSVAPIEQRLAALRLPLNESATAAGVLGAHVEVTSGGATVAGRLLSAETIVRGSGADRVEAQGISIVTGEGEMRTYELSPARQLDAQETRLDALKEEMARSTLARDAAGQELASTVAGLSFDFAGPK